MTEGHRVIVVGATGRVGAMVRRSWDLCPPIDMQVHYQTRQTEGDLTWDPLEGSTPLVEYVARNGTLDTMIVLAGVVPAGGGDLSLNRSIAQACLDAAAQVGIGRVLLASSSAVYGAWKDGAFGEGDALKPLNDYGRAKVAMEAVCAPFRDNGLEVCCLRIGNVAGADALLLNANQPEVVLDQFPSRGFPVRSYIAPQTFARMLDSLVTASAALPECLNIAAPVPVSMKDLAEAAGMNWRARPAPSGAQESITLDCTVLSHIHRFDAADGSVDGMVRDWRAVRE